MKIGLRKPSPKKSFKAMTTGKIKRKIKKTIIPGYGKKGTGLFKNPKKAIYNKVYHKTTFGIKDLAKTKRKKTSKKSSKNKDSNLIVDAFVWLFVISFFIAILPFYLIYHIIFKKK